MHVDISLPANMSILPQRVSKVCGSLLEKGNAPGRMGVHADRSWGPARLKRLEGGSELGATGWVARGAGVAGLKQLERGSELGARNTGWVARGSELGPAKLDDTGPWPEAGWVCRGARPDG